MSKFIGRSEITDEVTGEVVEVISFIPEVQDKNWVKCFRLLSERVLHDLQQNGLNGATDILFWFMDKIHEYPVDAIAEIYAPHERIAQETGLAVRTVARHIITLCERGYLKQVRPRQQTYQVNPEMIFKGKLNKLKGAKLLT